ncbi:tetratricopeptide repeat protein [Haloimpatiens lingqiaonensis]|uniref:tetratricopeptide repeat protein n=1 Tax=Haloimpatiens lingqiaonensis TaxID=1380675 RepID=UPI0010FEF285|nr:hypothetical protein [Haloimpatiens lingqiaonensis]
MDKSSKLYRKAVKVFEKGYIDKALNISKKSLQCNNKNSSTLNFIGLLYYFKGELGNAQKMWNINYKYNGDMVSKKYLQDSKNDKERLSLYIKGVKLYDDIKINDSLEMFTQCEKSDFNCINLNNYIASCYIKKGDYKKSEDYINKVLTMDRYNEAAIKNKKMLQKYGVINKSYKKEITWIIAIMLIVIVSFLTAIGLRKYLKKFKDSNSQKIVVKKEYKEKNEDKNKDKVEKNQQNKQNKNSIGTNNKNSNDTKNNADNQKGIAQKQAFDLNIINAYISEKDFYKIYNYIENIKEEQLTINEKLAYHKSVELLRSEGVNFFYQKALEENKNNKIKEAKEDLIRAKKFSDNNYLQEHILYFLATTYEKEEDIQNALVYYNEYRDNYAKGNYEEVVLYKLAILNRFNDINLAKKYARELKNYYGSSIYNNSKINDILNGK